MENELHQARMLGIFVELDQEAYFDDNSDDGFPHKGLPIFARNKQICQELDTRQRKKKLKQKKTNKRWAGGTKDGQF